MKVKIIKYILKKICQYCVRQGYQYRVAWYYEIMHREAKQYYTEDNGATLESFLIDSFKKSLNTLTIEEKLKYTR